MENCELKYSVRRTEHPLDWPDLNKIVELHGRIMFVYISSEDLPDGRKGYRAGEPLTDLVSVRRDIKSDKSFVI